MSELDAWVETKHFLTSQDASTDEIIARLSNLSPLERLFWYGRQDRRHQSRTIFNQLFKAVSTAERHALKKRLTKLHNAASDAAKHAYGYHLAPSPFDREAFGARHTEAWEKLFADCADYPKFLIWAALDGAMNAYR